MAQPYIGEIRMVGFNFAPAGWALCDGQAVPISENDALFALIGTTYGGDGQETFNLPNLQSRIPVHMGQGPSLSNRVIGELAGVESVTLTTQQIPVHNHQLFGSADAAAEETPAANVTAQSVANIYGNLPPFQPMNASMVQPAGGSQPHDNMHPFLVINFIISLFGLFPSQT